MYALNHRFKDSVFYIALFGLIAIWYIPHTIAARYFFEYLLLLLLISTRLNWKLFIDKTRILLIFIAYLGIQIAFFSTDYKVALSSFKSEWMHFILFSIIGAGAGLYVSQQKHKNILFYIGFAFSVPLLIHLVLFLIKGIQDGVIPWQYWGINALHGELGYTALQASIFFTVFLLFQSKTLIQKLVTSVMLLVCILSPLFALSRGGVAFVIASIFITIAAYFVLNRKFSTLGKKEIIAVLIAISSIGILIKVGISADPNRWGGTISRTLIGFHGNPTDVFCNGIQKLSDSLKAEGIEITPEIEWGLARVVDGEGTRVMVARAGIELVPDYPFGINGSRQAYQTAMQKLCGKEPTIFVSHAHNAWIDTSLAIGIPGAILLLLVMLNYVYCGLKIVRKNNGVNAFALALVITASIWIVRGLIDSTLRDQMLEMQAFIFAFLLVMASQSEVTHSSINNEL